MTRTRLKTVLAKRQFVVAPGVFDMFSARIADRIGFPALYMTGYGVSGSYLGVADAGLVTYRDMVERARTIADGTSDAADRRCRHRLRRADQCAPDRARLRGGRRAGDPDRGPGDAEEVRPHAEPARDRRAPTCAARSRSRSTRARSADTLIIARTDARTGLGPRRGDPARPGVRQGRRRHRVRRGAGERGRVQARRRGDRLLAARQHGADRQVAGGLGREAEGVRLQYRDLSVRRHVGRLRGAGGELPPSQERTARPTARRCRPTRWRSCTS